MKQTLLEIVQSILSDMDSEEVNSISDSVEALQIASVVEDTFFNLVSIKDIPEHKKLIQLTSLSDNTKPTHFKYPTNTKEIEKFFYNTDTSGNFSYKEIYYLEPMEFLRRQPRVGTDTVSVTHNEYTIVVYKNKMPSFYTSFDDEYIICDAYDLSEESTLQASKTRAYGQVYPTFTISDSFVPDLDDTLRPLLLAEAKSTCFSLFKSGPDAKVEQAARRLKTGVLNDMYRTKQENKRNRYGR